MIYAAFTMWLFLILFAGMGVYRLWGRIVPTRWVNWALLPGTVVSEMAYIFGCLITGGEIRRAKLMESPGRGHKPSAETGEAPTQATQRLKVAGPIIAALMAITACGAAILVAHSLLGATVMDRFQAGTGGDLPQQLPTSWEGLWGQVHRQVDLLRGAGETFAALRWTDWRVPLFMYLAMCLAIRLAPGRRKMAPTLAAAVLIALAIAIVGAASRSFGNLVRDVWPLLTYVWANLLSLLVFTSVLCGLVALVRNLRGKGQFA